jgi:hypothetical protein
MECDAHKISRRRPTPSAALKRSQARESSLARMRSQRSKGGHEMPTTTATKIGFVGLGHMGGNMAARFLAADTRLRRVARPRRRDELVHEGLQWRDTPREVAEAADVLITSVPNDDVLESVASGPTGSSPASPHEDLDRHEHGQPAREP